MLIKSKIDTLILIIDTINSKTKPIDHEKIKALLDQILESVKKEITLYTKSFPAYDRAVITRQRDLLLEMIECTDTLKIAKNIEKLAPYIINQPIPKKNKPLEAAIFDDLNTKLLELQETIIKLTPKSSWFSSEDDIIAEKIPEDGLPLPSLTDTPIDPNSMLFFALQHPKLTAGLIGLFISAVIIASVMTLGVAGVAAGIGAAIGLSGTAGIIAGTALPAAGAGLLAGLFGLFAMKQALPKAEAAPDAKPTL